MIKSQLNCYLNLKPFPIFLKTSTDFKKPVKLFYFPIFLKPQQVLKNL